MKENKFPRIFVCSTAKEKAFKEADKFFELGRKKEGRPWEAAMYPLAHLVLKQGIHKSPLDIVELAEIERIVVTNVFYPPDKFKDYSAHAAKFKNGEEASEYLNRVLSIQINKYPLLDVFCKQHSHPGFGMAFLSSGDLHNSIYNAYEWFRQKGLNTMFSFILTPKITEKSWKYHCFALRENSKHAKLPVEIISPHHNFVKEAKKQPYYKKADGANWCDQSKNNLKKNGVKVTRNLLRRGWRGYLATINETKFVICIPPFFPSQTVKVYRVAKELGQSNKEIILPLNSVWRKLNLTLENYNLLRLIDEIKEIPDGS